MPFGGVQSWCETIAKALNARQIKTEFWGPRMRLPSERFDLCLLANASKAYLAAKAARKAVNICHGVIAEEKPFGDLPVVYTSEEIRDHWRRPGPIVPQPIDMEFWSPDDSRRDLLLFYSYRSPESLGLERTAEALGLRFVWIKSATHETARAAMRQSAICFASGRAALEAMACNAPTVVCDWRDYNGGPLMQDDLEQAARRNYSGRGGVDPRAADLVEIARRTIEAQRPRDYVEARHEAKAVADALLKACA